ncbi:MAG: hypothetical protein CVV07_02520 [Gammaproteobacteria bacterium HGW-Gammaproteobacteria-11]|nr:MAG: hypothetical protein CVV07_02520 [Gammaproteobacteria bacterium HGW-Gammaproteobacteria-11]
MDDFEARIADLEVRLVFQDDSIQSLSELVTQQQLEMERMRRALEVLARRQSELAASIPGEATDDDQPPPHY